MAAEADACAKELTQILKQRMVTQKDEAAECIQMVRKLGEPIESLQEDFLLCMHKRMEGILTEGEAIADLMAPGLDPRHAKGQVHTCSICQTATQKSATKYTAHIKPNSSS